MEKQHKERIATTRFRRLNSLHPHCLFTVSSTQDYLANELRSDKEGEFVVSEVQNEGRGREGRTWVSPRGGLWVSITLKPDRSELADKITDMATRSVMGTLSEEYSLAGCSIKLPNDVICNGKKLAGVRVDAIVKGITTVAYLGKGN